VAKSFLKRINPATPRMKMIEWPFPVEDEERPKVKLRVLGLNELEAAHLATIAHFKDRKPPVRDDSSVFVSRERAELIFRAYSDEDGKPLADDADEMMEQPPEVLMELHLTRMQFQADAAAAPHTPAEMDALVDHLKKNMDARLLSDFPSTWLIELITTLAGQLPPSTPANERG
jgi:hypothetical protein